MALPASALVLNDEWKMDILLSSWFAIPATGLVTLGVCYVLVDRFFERRQDPLLLIGRISGGITYVVDPQPFLNPSIVDDAKQWLRDGYWNTIKVEVDAACRLRSDGTAASDAKWRGSHVVGVRWAVHRRLIDGEHCVLLCAGDGSVQFRVGDIAQRGYRAKGGRHDG
jgi:hypothetical protein